MRNAVFVSVPVRPEGGTTVKKTYKNLLCFVIGVMLLLCFKFVKFCSKHFERLSLVLLLALFILT